MRRGEPLNGFKSIVSAVHMTNPAVKTFLLTHTPLVGHELKASPKDVDVLKDFVNWVNNDKIGNTVEAVFCGHTHENHIFYDVDEVEMDDPDDYYKPSGPYQWYETLNLAFSERPYYIETYSATKEG